MALFVYVNFRNGGNVLAEYDGSIRIGIKIDSDNAEKQLENLKKRQLSQKKAIDAQAKAVQNLVEQYQKLTTSSEEPKGLSKTRSALRAANKEAEEAYKKYEWIQTQAQMDKSAYGEVSPENSYKLQEALNELNEANLRVDNLQQKLNLLKMPPESTEEAKRLKAEIEAENESLSRLIQEYANTQKEIDSTQAEVDQFSESLRAMKETAVVADQGILDLQRELSALRQHLSVLEEAEMGLGYKDYDETVSKINSIEAKLKEYRDSIQETNQTEQQTNLGGFSGKLKSFGDRLGTISSSIKSSFVKSMNSASRSTKTLHDRMSRVGRNRGFDKAGKSASKFSSKLKNVGNRLKSIVSGALIFNVISRGLTELTKQVGSYLSANKKFSDALATIKGNLLTAFQPIYEKVMPALNSLMSTLQEATAIAAKFVAGLFGTTAEKAQANAKALRDQAKATEEAGEEAKKAEKFLASFDTIEILGNKKSDSKEEEKNQSAFNQDFSNVKVPSWLDAFGETLKSLMDFLKDFFKPIKESWDKYGASVIDALKRAFSAVLDVIKAIAKTFMEVWNSPLAQETLKLIMNLFTLILGIIEDIAVAFRAAWSYYGEEVVRALFFMLNSVLELLISIGTAFREAWNDNGRGQKIFETILQIISNIFKIVGELAGRLREAWEANGNGQAIWAAILEIVQSISNFILDITSATLKWAKSLNLEPLISGVRDVLENIKPLVDKIGETLSEIYHDTVLPFMSWLIETAIPKALDLFGNISRFLTEHEGLWDGIKEVVNKAFEFIMKTANATQEWAENLDLEALASSFQSLMESLPKLFDLLSDVYNDVILPLFTNLLEEWLPFLLDKLTGIIDFLSENKELVEAFVSAWVLGGVVSTVATLASKLNLVTLALGGATAAVIEMINNWSRMNDMEKSLSVIGSVLAALGALCVMLFAAKGGIAGVALGVAAVVGGIAMVNSAISKANSGHSGFSMGMFGGTVGASKMVNMARISAYMGTEKLPHLAKGAVISPNSEFLAVLGDQRSGKNVEAPLAAIGQEVENALSRWGGGGPTKVEINYTGSLSQIARVLQPEIKVIEQRKGPTLTTLG